MMRRTWLLLLTLSALAIGAAFPTTADARSVLGLISAPLRMVTGLAFHHRIGHRRGRTRQAARPRAVPAQRAALPEAESKLAPAALQGTYWPVAFTDLFGFALTAGKDDRFWTHGANDLFAAMLAPSAVRGAQAAARRVTAADTDAGASACASDDKRSTNTAGQSAANALYIQVEQRVQPTASQRDAFKDLRSSMVEAGQRITANCPADYAAASPPERLKLMSDRLWAMRQAMLIVRTPLETAYNALTSQQKARLAAANTGSVNCKADLAAAATWPNAETMQPLQPNEQQQAALETLRLTSSGMAQWLASSCPQQSLSSPVARLDAAGDRLNALLYASKIIGRSLDNAYGLLTDEQKAKFQTLSRRQAGSARAAELEGR